MLQPNFESTKFLVTGKHGTLGKRRMKELTKSSVAIEIVKTGNPSALDDMLHEAVKKAFRVINDDSPPPYNIFALSDDANSILYACDGRSAFIGALEFDESSLAAFFAIAEVVSAIASVKTLYMLGYGFHEIVTENIASANLMSGDVQDEFEAMKTAIGNYANVPFNDGIDKLKQMFTSKW